MAAAAVQRGQQYQAEIVTIVEQLAALPPELQATTSFRNGLEALITGLQSLSQSDPALSPFIAALRTTGRSPTGRSVFAQVALIVRLLTDLSRADPAAARRLTLALPALHFVVSDLLAAVSGGIPLRPLAVAASGPFDPLRTVLVPSRWRETILPAGVTVTVTTSAQPPAEATPAQASSTTAHGIRRRVISRGSSAPATGLPEPPPATAPPLGGAAAGASGGIGAGAAAGGLLLAVLIGWLIDALAAGRLQFHLVPRPAMLLAGRLERPG
ncbi:MAG: hypothetical protein JO168_14550 [Solirubrobacterales bacterium]|nr:hypothetical protein [Solirubrobacterales bacterium]MBV9717331.1 hypothetical protein [Solirubrobacterales bacterium]